MTELDVEALRATVPLLQRELGGKRITYLDNAATTARPRAVIDAVRRFDEEVGANIHRGKHALSEDASEMFEKARGKVARLVGVPPRQLVFTQNATHAVNLVASGLELAGGNVVVTQQEHHSNLLPWQGRCELRVAPASRAGAVDPEAVLALVDEDTRVVALNHISNATGAIHPVREIADGARARGALVLVDAAQSAPHLEGKLADLGADLMAFSAHKMLGPTGIGALAGTREALERLRPTILGGGAPRMVTADSWDPKPVPFRFEAGTPPIAQAIGFGAAVDVLSGLGAAAVRAHLHALGQRLVERAAAIPGVEVLGPPAGAPRAPLVSVVFDSKGLTPDHVAMMLSDRHAIMVRSGHHCCHPYFDGHGMSVGSLRASAYVYNTLEEIDRFGDALAVLLERLHK